MWPRLGAIGYEDFQPKPEWKIEGGANVLLLRLPGFKKEQIRSKYEKSNRIIRVSGECPIDNNIRRRFNEVFVLPEHINADKFYASFENGIFKIIFPDETVTQVDPNPKQEAQIAPFPPKAVHEKEGKEKVVSFQTPPTDTAKPMAQNGHDETPPQVDSTKRTMKQADNNGKDEKKETSEANEKPTESKMCKNDAKATKKDVVEGQLLAKMLMFVIVAVGTYISYRLGTSRKAK